MGIEVASVDALPEGGHLVAKVVGRDILLVRWHGNVYAIRNICPHQSQSFEHGRTHARLTTDSETGDLIEMPDQPVVTCPWHGWEFDLAKGGCVVDPGYRVRTYKTSEVDGKIYVDLGTPDRRARTDDAPSGDEWANP